MYTFSSRQYQGLQLHQTMLWEVHQSPFAFSYFLCQYNVCEFEKAVCLSWWCSKFLVKIMSSDVYTLSDNRKTKHKSYCLCKTLLLLSTDIKTQKVKRDSHWHWCFVRRGVFSNNTCSIWNRGLREGFDACLRFYRNLIKKQHTKLGETHLSFLLLILHDAYYKTYVFLTTCSGAACCTTCIVWNVLGLWT